VENNPQIMMLGGIIGTGMTRKSYRTSATNPADFRRLFPGVPLFTEYNSTVASLIHLIYRKW